MRCTELRTSRGEVGSAASMAGASQGLLCSTQTDTEYCDGKMRRPTTAQGELSRSNNMQLSDALHGQHALRQRYGQHRRVRRARLQLQSSIDSTGCDWSACCSYGSGGCSGRMRSLGYLETPKLLATSTGLGSSSEHVRLSGTQVRQQDGTKE